MVVSYCTGCGKRVLSKTKKCKCGCTSFVYGNKDTFKVENKIIKCKCGGKMKRIIHLSYDDRYVTNYKCLDCGNVIGIENYIDFENIYLDEEYTRI